MLVSFQAVSGIIRSKYQGFKLRLARHLYSSAPIRTLRIRKLRNIVQRRPLRVAFEIAQAPKWKSTRLLRLMQQHPRFEPFFWIVPQTGDREPDTRRCRELCDSLNTEAVEYANFNHFPAEQRPDIIFVQEPYQGWVKGLGLVRQTLCYIPYCVHLGLAKEAFESLGMQISLYAFLETQYIAREAARITRHKGGNFVVTGAAVTNDFLNPQTRDVAVWKETGKAMKKVIWAPHWTLTKEHSWFAQGTFLQTAEAMQRIAAQHADTIQFAFKPHPNLYRELCKEQFWGKEKTDAFYHWWATQANTQLEEGAYAALFMQSDGMIHDSGSFVLEYMFADKPALFLIRDKDIHPPYHEMTQEALRCHDFGFTQEDITLFLRQRILGGDDTAAARRAELLRTHLMPPNGKCCAENVFCTLLQELGIDP